MQQQMKVEPQQDAALLTHLQHDLDAQALLANLRRDLRQSEGDNAVIAP
jgi:hypothetical protein